MAKEKDSSQKEFMLKEDEKLRAELLHLKNCQVQYFWSTVTATSTILGLGFALAKDQPGHILQNYFCLAPLIIIIPCWVVFFDKATTITRIVGYNKILEYQILNPKQKDFAYIGWENALKLFRDVPNKRNEDLAAIHWYKLPFIQLKNMFTPGAKHKYWTLMWLTFFLSALFCLAGFLCATKFAGYSNRICFLISCLVFIVTFNYTIYLSFHLTNDKYGKYTYSAKERSWKIILSGKDAMEHFIKFPGISKEKK
jgi:hypothetical protein